MRDMDRRCLDQLIRLAQETARGLRSGVLAVGSTSPDRSRSEQLATELTSFIAHRLLPLRHRWITASESPYVLALVGLTNVGKSTILQVLLGAAVAPRGNRPMTSVPVWYRFSAEWSLEIAQPGARLVRTHHPTASSLADRLHTIMTDGVTQGSSQTWLRVQGPMDLLRDGLELVDTPGFGAAQGAAEVGTHQQRLDQFLRTRVHRIYFCVAANTGLVIKPEEHDYYQRIRNACGHVIVNKWTGDLKDQIEYAARFRPLFENAEFVFVDARRATRRRLSGESVEGDDGFDQLLAILDATASPAGREAECARELPEAWTDLLQHLDAHLGVKQVPWHSFELSRLRACIPHGHSLGALVSDQKGSPA